MRAPAKLTRTLRVVGRRADGYHLLESEMLSLDLADLLEIDADGTARGASAGAAAGTAAAGSAGATTGASPLEVVDEVSWLGAAGGNEPPSEHVVPSGAANLVVRALEAVGRRAAVRLRKRIPAGAGLGGGSADAAAVLRWAGVRDLAVALRLGADVPFCLTGGRAMVRGVGEVVEPLPIEPATFLLCTPPIGVSTVAAYRAFDDLGAGPPDPARRNDLEHAALAVEPALVLWRDVLTDVTGHRPQLAGSGSTWFVELAPGAGEGVAEALATALRAAGARATITLARAVGAEGVADQAAPAS